MPRPTAKAANSLGFDPVVPFGNAGICAGLQTYYAQTPAYAGYVTPTDMFSLRNPVGSGKLVIPRVQSMLIGSTAAAVMKTYWFRRNALNTGGTPTDLVPVKYDTLGDAPVGVARTYGSAPVIVDAAAVVNLLIASSAVLAAAPTNFNTSGGSFGNALNLSDFATPLVLRPGEEFAMNLAGAAIPAGFTAICQISWMETNA